MSNQTPSCIHVLLILPAELEGALSTGQWSMKYMLQSADENGTQWINHRNNMYSSRTQGEQVELAPHTLHQAWPFCWEAVIVQVELAPHTLHQAWPLICIEDINI
jgi:hypothetical protein